MKVFKRKKRKKKTVSEREIELSVAKAGNLVAQALKEKESLRLRLIEESKNRPESKKIKRGTGYLLIPPKIFKSYRYKFTCRGCKKKIIIETDSKKWYQLYKKTKLCGNYNNADCSSQYFRRKREKIFKYLRNRRSKIFGIDIIKDKEDKVVGSRNSLLVATLKGKNDTTKLGSLQIIGVPWYDGSIIKFYNYVFKCKVCGNKKIVKTDIKDVYKLYKTFKLCGNNIGNFCCSNKKFKREKEDVFEKIRLIRKNESKVRLKNINKLSPGKLKDVNLNINEQGLLPKQKIRLPKIEFEDKNKRGKKVSLGVTKKSRKKDIFDKIYGF